MRIPVTVWPSPVPVGPGKSTVWPGCRSAGLPLAGWPFTRLAIAAFAATVTLCVVPPAYLTVSWVPSIATIVAGPWPAFAPPLPPPGAGWPPAPPGAGVPVPPPAGAAPPAVWYCQGNWSARRPVAHAILGA